MMTNLFSTFDPTTLFFSLNWLSSLLVFLILPPMFWLIPSRFLMFWLNTTMLIHKEFKILIKSEIYKGSTLIFMNLFLFILLNNFMGLFPYIFTSTSHINITLALSLPLWLSFIMFSLFYNTTHLLAHLVPQGAPFILLPFLVIVESISNIIRPGTLAIRLMANMVAGHLLLTLLSSTGPSLNSSLIMILLIIQILLLLLEFAVSIIQSYVFSILATLYSSEAA